MNKQKKSSGKSKGTSDGAAPVVRRLQSVEASDDQLTANNSATSLNGTYMNACFVRAFFAIYGREVEVTVKNGAVYHGILYSMSERGEILLKCVHRILGPSEDPSQAVTNPSTNTLEDFIAFTSDLIVQMVCKNVSLQSPPPANESSALQNKPYNQNNHVNGTRHSSGAGGARSSAFLTDTEVTGQAGNSTHRGAVVNSSTMGGAPYVNGVDNGGLHMERELTPWCPEVSDANNGDDELLETLDDHTLNGWTAEDMLKTNRENCGVEDCEYDESKYTLELDKNSEDYQKNLHWANEKAREMQESLDYSRLLVETNETGEEDEEVMFSAVDRNTAAGEGMSHRSPSCNNSSVTSSTTPPSESNNTASVSNSVLSSSPGNNVNNRGDFTTVYNKRSSNRSNRGGGGNSSGSMQQHAPVPLINNSGTGPGGGLSQRSNYRSGKHTGANMGPGSGGAGGGPGPRSGGGSASSSGSNAPRRFVSSHNQQKTANALQQQQTFNNTGASNGDVISNQPQFGYTDSSTVPSSQNNKQGQSYGGPNPAYNTASGAPMQNQGRINKEQNLKNFSKNIQLRDSPASHSNNNPSTQSNKMMSSVPSAGSAAAATAKTNQVTSPLSKQHAHVPMTSSPSSPNTRQGIISSNAAPDSAGGGTNAMPAKHTPPHNAWNRPPQIHNNTPQIAANNLPGAGTVPAQQLPTNEVKNNSTSHGIGSPPTITRSNSIPSKNLNNSGKPAGQPGGHLSKKRPSDTNITSSEKSSTDTTPACAKEGISSESGDGAKEPANEFESPVSQNDNSLSSGASAKELSLNEDETEIVKNSKLNVKAQEFKPSGNFFSPTASQEATEDTSSAMTVATGLTSGVSPHVYFSPQNPTPIDTTVVSAGVMSPHFAMMATPVQSSMGQTHPHVSTGTNGGSAEEAQAQALVASNVPFAAAGPPHLPQFMHIAPHSQYPFPGMAAQMSLHGQPIPAPGGNSGAPATVNMFQTVPQVPLQQVSTPAPHLQAGVPAIAPRHIAPFGSHIPVSGHGIPVQFAAPIIPHHSNVGANAGVANSGVGVGSGVATHNTSSPTFQPTKQYRPRGSFRNPGQNSQFYHQNNNVAASVSSLVGPPGQHVSIPASGATSAGGVGQMQYHPVFNPNNGGNTPGGPFSYHQTPLIAAAAAAQGIYSTSVGLTPVVGPPPTAQQQQHNHGASQQLSLSQSGNSSVSNGGGSAGSSVSAQQQSNSQQIPPLTVAGGTPGVGVVANYFPHPGGHHNTVTVPSMYPSSMYNQQVRMAMQPPPHGVVLDHGVANIAPQFVAQTIAATSPATGAGNNQQQSQPGLLGTPGGANGGAGPNMTPHGGQGQSTGAGSYNNNNTNFSQQQSQDYAVSYPPLPSTNTHNVHLGMGNHRSLAPQTESAPFSANGAININDLSSNEARDSLSQMHTSPPPIIASTGSMVMTAQTSENHNKDHQPSGTILASTASVSRRASGSNISSGGRSNSGITSGGRGRHGSARDSSNTPHYQYQQGKQHTGSTGVLMNSPRGSQDATNTDSFPFMESHIPLLSTVISATNNNAAMLTSRDGGGAPVSLEMAGSANNPAISGSALTNSVNGGTGAPSGTNGHQGGNGNTTGGNGSSGAPPGTTNGGVVPAAGVVMAHSGPVAAVQAHAAAQQLAAAVAANRNSQIAAVAGGTPAGHAGAHQAAHASYPMYMIMQGAAQAQNMLHAQAAAVQQMQLHQQQQQEHHHRNSLSGQGAIDFATHRGGGAGSGQDMNNRGDK